MAQDKLQIAIEDHRAGRLTKAEAGYLSALCDNPGNPDALHWLGVLRFQAGQFAEAIELLERAIEGRQDDPAFHHNLGQAYLSAGKKDAAIKAFTRAVAIDPDGVEALISLGMACLSRGLASDPAAAISALRTARACGIDTAEMHHRLGVAYLAGRRFAEAISSLKTATEKNANDATILFHLALAHRGASQLKETRKFLIKALEIEPALGHAWRALGMLDAEAGKFNEAAGLFRRAIAANRDDLEAHRGLASALSAAGKSEEAEHARKQMQRIKSASAATSLAAPQDAADDSKVAALEKHLTPSEVQAQIHFGMAVVMNVFPPSKLPSPAVVDLFDKYAPGFDEHLRRLGYAAPQAIAAALADVWNGHPLDILDLGCGTGLCGPLLKPMANSITGVDLSPGMIDKARLAGVYDRLEVGDIVENLRLRPKAYDLLVSADVLIYLGDLSPTFEAAAGALRPGGLFAFSVEAGAADRYQFQKNSHRFAHSKPYLQRLASIFGFIEVNFLDVQLRMEAGKPVPGFLVILRLL